MRAFPIVTAYLAGKCTLELLKRPISGSSLTHTSKQAFFLSSGSYLREVLERHFNANQISTEDVGSKQPGCNVELGDY